MHIDSIYKKEIQTSFDMEFQSLTETNEFQGRVAVERVVLKAATHYPPHYHNHSDAFLYFLEGSGDIVDEQGKHFQFKEGSTVYFPANKRHGFSTNERVVFVTVQSPPILNPKNGEEDFFFDE